MPRKTVLVAGASGLVGYAAMKHFAGDAACEVIAVSRRRPDETFGARFVAADLTNAQSCSEIFSGAFDDPKVPGVACHVSQARTGGRVLTQGKSSALAGR